MVNTIYPVLDCETLWRAIDRKIALVVVLQTTKITVGYWIVQCARAIFVVEAARSVQLETQQGVRYIPDLEFRCSSLALLDCLIACKNVEDIV